MNNWFSFKQFTVYQDRCAQKVSEVACVFAAWVEATAEMQSALDIGAGHGLLSLMLAQRYPHLKVDAVEIDPACAEQLKRNVDASPFSHRIATLCQNILDFEPALPYDFMVCNPPFFEKQLRSATEARNAAWHSTQLTLSQLLQYCAPRLADHGRLCVLLPAERKTEVAQAGWHIRQEVLVAHSANHAPKVVMLELAKTPCLGLSRRLDLHEGDGYTREALQLLKPFYLKL